MNALLTAITDNEKALEAAARSGLFGRILGALHERGVEEPNREEVPIHLMKRIGSYFSAQSVGDDGIPVTRTKNNAPYTYDTFVQFDDGTGIGDPRSKHPSLKVVSSESVIRQRTYKDLSMKHFGTSGHYWDRRSASSIEQFLREALGSETLVLHRILEGCNKASGYPFWEFKFTTDEA